MGRAVATKLAERVEAAHTVELAADVSSVPAARHLVQDDLRARGLPATVIDNALIVVTELVSNAVLHAKPLELTGSVAGASTGIVLRWAVHNGTVSVDVTDGGGIELPAVKRTPPADTAGRGLAIVDAVTRDWTVEVEPGRVTVHAVVAPWH